MAQFDVYTVARRPELLVDCQSDLLSGLSTRFVVPLVPEGLMRPGGARFNPTFLIGARRFILAPQGAATVPAKELTTCVASLAEQQITITAAIDFLTAGV